MACGLLFLVCGLTNSPLWSLLLLGSRPYNEGYIMRWSWQWCIGQPWVSSIVNFVPIFLGWVIVLGLISRLTCCIPSFLHSWLPCCPQILQELNFLVRTSGYNFSFSVNCCCLLGWSQLGEPIIKSPSASYPAWEIFYLVFTVF